MRNTGLLAALEALPEAIALTLLAALPAFLNFASAGVFEEEKSLLLRAGALLSLPGVCVGWRTHGAWLRRHASVITFAAFAVVLLVASVAGVAPREAFLGGHLRRHGSVTTLALSVIFSAMCFGARTPEGRQRLLGAVALGSIWPSLFLLLQLAGLDPTKWVSPTLGFLPGSTFGNHVMFGGYLAAVAPLTAALAWQSRGLGWSAVLVLQLSALVLSGSRGAMVAIAGGGLAVALVVAWTRLPRRALASAVAALVIVIAALVMVPSMRPAPIARQLDPSVGSARVRVLIWKGVISLMRDSGGRLWFGYGPESLASLYPPYYVPELAHLEGIDAIPDRAHNETLDTLVGAGAVGVALEIAFFAATIIGALRVADLGLRAGLVAAATGHVIEIQFGIATVVSRLVFLCIAAMVIGANTSKRRAALYGPPGHSVAPVTRGKKESAAPWAWLSVAVVIAALSPILSTLPLRLGAEVTSGTEMDLLASLSRVSLATPLLYLALFGTALFLSRSLTTSVRPTQPWLQICGLAAGGLVMIPLSIVPSRADIMSQAGSDLEFRQQWPGAAIAYREASRLQPRDSFYLAGLGRALIQDAIRIDPPLRDERLRMAGEAYERALSLAPNDLDHTRHLASLLRLQAWSAGDDETARAGPLARADRLYVEATARAPLMTSLWIDWAHIEVDRRRPAEALQKVTRALELDPAREDARLILGELQAQLAR